MFNNVTTDYTGADATWEILIMLAVAFALGYFYRWCLDRYFGRGEELEEMSVSLGMADVFGRVFAEDDLKIVEGIGPKIEEILKKEGINNWSDLAVSDYDHLKRILEKAGSRFQMHDPKTWAEQARMAVAGDWQELKEFQDFLIGGL